MKFHFFIAVAFYCLNSCGYKVAYSKLYDISVVATSLNHPWGIVFLDKNTFLVSERNGGLKLISKSSSRTISGLPDNIVAQSQGGLLDLALHPKYNENGFIFLAYSKKKKHGESATAVLRFRLKGYSMADAKEIFEARPYKQRALHYGAKIDFDERGHMFISLGDRYDYPSASQIENVEASSPQDISTHMGKVIRLNEDGTVPEDNPFVGMENARPEIFSLGHRNPQGLFYDKASSTLYLHEHGAMGGDELNIIVAGKNYGWPVITYGKDYSGHKIGRGVSEHGMEQPLHYWDPSIAPSGMCIYYGDKYPKLEWKGSIFICSLKFGQLRRLKIYNGKVTQEEVLIDGEYGRLRDVKESLDGYLYVLTDEADGKVLKIMSK